MDDEIDSSGIDLPDEFTCIPCEHRAADLYDIRMSEMLPDPRLLGPCGPLRLDLASNDLDGRPLTAGRVSKQKTLELRVNNLSGDVDQASGWGAWYDLERSGEGFVVEVLDDGRGLVCWFTYQPEELMHQAWMVGTGEFERQTLVIDGMIQPIGGVWGEDFNPAAIVHQPWGSLTLEFSGKNSGHAYWDSVDPAYGSGDHPIQRLSSVRMAGCGDS